MAPFAERTPVLIASPTLLTMATQLQQAVAANKEKVSDNDIFEIDELQ